ncbi:transcription factor bHLH68-like [Olea europaea var. sylvestris]|uniref:Transcription factor bHLH68 n=1 Tax=Olea europaea subsp. europaea TaxID=158383 RepID=A0A8S0S1V5_OLEEU|nr:transcription factor bHLH68-like [Olea europaea var. sylvestris]CAA2985236.1 transcription factor bHLH68 [Olea europaea subsp. europaea]
MNKGVVQSSPVQQMVAAGSPNWPWTMNNTTRPPTLQPHGFINPPVNYVPQYTAPSLSSWNDSQELPESWSQLLLGGWVGEEEKPSFSYLQAKVEYIEQLLNHQTSNGSAIVDVKQELSSKSDYIYGHGNLEFQASKPTSGWSQMIPAASSPKSCVTALSNNMMDFSNKPDLMHPQPDRSSDCNSTATGGVAKKARIQPSSSQSTFKVRKEKLGDRITALHQLVSPFGKTDTASVLLEAIGYIRFLQSQVEALSLPYLGSKSGNLRQQYPFQGEKNCLFPEDPGQLLNDNCIKMKQTSEQDCHEEPKDLRSRGLCLVPISCTLHVGSDFNGADYWASPALGGNFR